MTQEASKLVLRPFESPNLMTFKGLTDKLILSQRIEW
jgi:hypothetical protein